MDETSLLMERIGALAACVKGQARDARCRLVFAADELRGVAGPKILAAHWRPCFHNHRTANASVASGQLALFFAIIIRPLSSTELRILKSSAN